MLTQLVRYGRMLKVDFTAARCRVSAHWTSEGSVFAEFDAGTHLQDRVFDNNVAYRFGGDIQRLKDRYTRRQQRRKNA